jgi:hypothetical protein
MATALADQRISRKKAGEDVKILANRIALLKAEEQKAWKKIEETKKKAQDILEVRHRNIQKTSNKSNFKNQQEYERQVQAENNRRIKEDREKNIMYNKMSVYDRAQQEAMRLKNERMHHEEMVNMQKHTEELKNKSMKQMIRSQKAEAVNMREQEKNDETSNAAGRFDQQDQRGKRPPKEDRAGSVQTGARRSRMDQETAAHQPTTISGVQ